MKYKSNAEELKEMTDHFQAIGIAMRKRNVSHASVKKVHRWIEQDRLKEERSKLSLCKKLLHFIKNFFNEI